MSMKLDGACAGILCFEDLQLQNAADIGVGLAWSVWKKERAFRFDVTVAFQTDQIKSGVARLPLWDGNFLLREGKGSEGTEQNCGAKKRAEVHGRRSIVTVMVSLEPKVGASGKPGTGPRTSFVSRVAEREALSRLPSSREIVLRESA